MSSSTSSGKQVTEEATEPAVISPGGGKFTVTGSGAAPSTGPKADAPPPEADLPVDVQKALGDVRKAWSGQKRGLWACAFALVKLRDACRETGLPYLKVASEHLAIDGAELSSARISELVSAADYCRDHGLDKLPEDIERWPPVSLVVALRRLVGKDLTPARKQRADDLHEQVFSADPKKRPSYEEATRIVDSILGPPKKKGKKGDDDPPPGLAPQVVEEKDVARWFRTYALNGKVTIHRIRVPKRTPEAIFAAIKSQWEDLKSATLIRIEG